MYRDVNVEVGAKIRREREERLNISREELSKRVGVSRPSIANIEEGRQNITLMQLYTIADALGTTAIELLPDSSSDNFGNLSKLLPSDVDPVLLAWVEKL